MRKHVCIFLNSGYFLDIPHISVALLCKIFIYFYLYIKCYFNGKGCLNIDLYKLYKFKYAAPYELREIKIRKWYTWWVMVFNLGVKHTETDKKRTATWSYLLHGAQMDTLRAHHLHQGEPPLESWWSSSMGDYLMSHVNSPIWDVT